MNRYTTEKTFEAYDADGELVEQIAVRIEYDFERGSSGYFNHVTGDGEGPSGDVVEWTKIDMLEGTRWVPARADVKAWAIDLTHTAPALFHPDHG